MASKSSSARERKRKSEPVGDEEPASSRPRLSPDKSDVQLQVASLRRFSSSNSNVSSVASPRPGLKKAWAGAQVRVAESCCLLSCSEDIESTAAAASIRISPADAKRCREFKSADAKAQIKWKQDGTATLHRPCFDTVKKSVGQGKKLPVSFGKFERSKVAEAVKQAEIFDSEEELIAKAHSLADALVAAKHVCVFSGAGLSTAAGIGDYRGLKGKWTEKDMGEDAVVEGEEEEGDDGVQYELLRPTLAHEGISYLVAQGLVKYVISQNCDGLHTLSGVPEGSISELHGNVFREYCEKCGREYERGHYVCFDDDLYYEELEEYGKTKLKQPAGTERCATCGLNHRTTRKCDDKKCNGWLRDTIINFGDDLRDHIWEPAEDNADKADLMICFGSTLEVTPACYLAEGPTRKRSRRKGKGGAAEGSRKLAIVNRQRTPLDAVAARAGLRCHGDCDAVMRYVLLKLMGAEAFEEWLRACDAKRLSYHATRSQAP